MTQLQTLQAALRERRLLKVIAGIENFDAESVLAIARAAQAGGAQAVDIACDAALIRRVKAETDLVVFVSSVDPDALVLAAEAGADVLELGNFDALYRAGVHPTGAQILAWAQAVKAGAHSRVPLCVTVSGHLALAEQLALAVSLKELGVEMLQTEGQVGPETEDTFQALAGAVGALGNTAEIRKVVDLPLMLAGGFNHVTAPFAIAAGADAVGIGKAVSRLVDEAAMAQAVREAVAAVSGVQAVGKGLALI